MSQTTRIMKLTRFPNLRPGAPLLASMLLGATATLCGAAPLGSPGLPAEPILSQDGGKPDKVHVETRARAVSARFRARSWRTDWAA